MKPTSKRLSSTLIALLFLVGAGIGYFEFVQPEYAAVQTLKGEEISQQALLTNEKSLVTQVQGIVTSYQSQSTQVQTVNLAMPIGQNNSEALAQIYGLAANGGLGIQGISVSVQPATAQTTAAAAAAVNAVNASGTVGANTAAILKPAGSISFQITATGTYEALKTFLQGLESNIRVFDVTSLSIRPASVNGNVSPSTDYFGYNITVVAYYQAS